MFYNVLQYNSFYLEYWALLPDWQADNRQLSDNIYHVQPNEILSIKNFTN